MPTKNCFSSSFTNVLEGNILHPATSCCHQCWISQEASRQMLVLLRCKVWPLMHYQAINSVTEARSSVRMRFKDRLRSWSCAGSSLRVLLPCGCGHLSIRPDAIPLLFTDENSCLTLVAWWSFSRLIEVNCCLINSSISLLCMSQSCWISWFT